MRGLVGRAIELTTMIGASMIDLDLDPNALNAGALRDRLRSKPPADFPTGSTS
jgi:hypothetical protein